MSNNQFDQVYHEHLSYFSVRSFERLAGQFDMEVRDVQRQSVHGGTIRVHIQRASADGEPTRMVHDLESLELALGLDGREAYDEFAHRVERTRAGITRLFELLKTDDVSIVGYGATAKGNVLLNYCDIGPETFDYILDTTPAKQGTYSPGKKVPVREPEVFYEDPPEYAVLLAWNYREAILENEAEREFRRRPVRPPDSRGRHRLRAAPRAISGAVLVPPGSPGVPADLNTATSGSDHLM
jgi:D-mycarose 3-C-methyltransferase